jgi:hypothetical protein
MTNSTAAANATPEVPQTVGSSSFATSIMPIRERKGGKTVFNKFLEIGIPTLDQVSSSLPAPDTWLAKEVKEGENEDQVAIIRTPVYNSFILGWVQDAIIQRIQSLARSRDNTGQLPCASWEELEEATGGGTKYPIQLRDFREKFASWLAGDSSPALSDKQQAALLTYTDAKRLMLADDAKKERVAVYLQSFVESLGDSVSEVSSVINTLNRALAQEVEEVDF